MFADSNNARIAFDESESTGEPVIMVTGFASSKNYWKPYVKAMSDYHCIFIDVRGSGSTEYEGSFTIDDLAEDVRAVMDECGVQSAHLIGWSMGSNVVVSFAAHYPERVKSISLLAPFIVCPERSWAYSWKLTEFAVNGYIDSNDMFRMFSYFCMSENDFISIRDSGYELPAPKRQRDPNDLREQLKAIIKGDRIEEASRITCPALIIHGTDDVMVPIRFGRQVADTIKDSSFVEVEGAGHTLTAESCVKDIISFLDSL